MSVTVHIASDHRGVRWKQQIIDLLHRSIQPYRVADYGPFETSDTVDYPTQAHRVCDAIVRAQTDETQNNNN